MVACAFGVGVLDLRSETAGVDRRMGIGVEVLMVKSETAGVVKRIGWVGVIVGAGCPPWSCSVIGTATRINRCEFERAGQQVIKSDALIFGRKNPAPIIKSHI